MLIECMDGNAPLCESIGFELRLIAGNSEVQTALGAWVIGPKSLD
jgi:hypothetical protein